MAVTQFRLIGEKRGGGQFGAKARRYKQVFRAETNDPYDGPAVVMAHATCPVQFVTTYSSGNDSDDEALCEEVQVEEEGDSRLSWIVTATFTTLITQFADLNNPPNENPLLDAPKFSFSFDQFTTIARRAINFVDNKDGAIRNTLGEIFRPGVEVDDSRAVYVVQRNESFPNLPFIMEAVNTVNQNAWKACPPRTVKCKSITSGDIQYRNSFPFYVVRYEFHLNRDTWDIRPLNKSTKYKDSNGKLQSIKTGEEPVTIYTGVDSSSQADQKVPVTANPGIDQIYRRFKYYRELDYSIFPF